MKLNSRQFIAIVAALCWIFAQNISLDHQYTAEHLSQTDSHICLSFATDQDDFVVSHSASAEKLEFVKTYFIPLQNQVESCTHNSFRARAPPVSLS